ncbi:hypothetical protein B7494_g4208 [Chlorociboria aeruginascens]|nr:hypothetical protein B7494_g4208 [Chlorociboria aeruginascens]
MASKKTLVVFGATGGQGGSVAKTFLSDAGLKSSWTIRAVTRDVTKPSAKSLEEQGAETIAADLNDASTLKAALKGAYAVFAVTNFWEKGDPEVEFNQGKAIADAAKEAGIQHFVWSSLLNITELSKGVLTHVSHFDSKAKVEKYIREIGIPATFFIPGFYMSNFPGGMFRQLSPDNAWTLSLPIPASTPIPLLDTVDDTGKFVKAILLHREETLGKRIYGATKYYTIAEIVNEFKELYPEAGKSAVSVELPHQVFKGILGAGGSSETAQEELLQNMRLLNEYGYYGGDGLEESHKILADKLTTWKEYMKKAPAFAELKNKASLLRSGQPLVDYILDNGDGVAAKTMGERGKRYSNYRLYTDMLISIVMPTATSSGTSITNPQSSSVLSSTSGPPTVPARPSTLTSAVNRNATAYSPYGANRLGGVVGASPYGGIGSAYSSPYARMGGYGGMGGMYGGMGGYGSMYGGGMGGMGGMYSGMGGMPGDPNDPNNLTNGFTQSTQATFQLIENIVGAFGGFAQMLESTYMATHSSFYAMISVAEQFGNLRNTLGSILGIFTILRWLRTLFAKITGRLPPADATSLTPHAFASFEGRTLMPDGSPTSHPRPSKKPFLFFLAAAFGLPYLMGKLIRALAASQEEEGKRRLAGGQLGPDGLPISPLDPANLMFCRVLYDFTPESGAAVQGVDLDVKKGDLVAVISKTDPLGQPSEWWRCRARDGRIGYLPGVYLEVARMPGQPVAEIKSASQSGSRSSSLTSSIKAPLVAGKAGDLSVESFQKSQFYS